MLSPSISLDPQGQAILDRIQASGAPPLYELSPKDARVAYLERTIKARPDFGSSVTTLDFGIPAEEHLIQVRKYSKPWESRGLQPALIYFHGGGFVTGGIDTHDTLCRQLAEFSGVAIFSVDYRLAPEHAFPAAVDDSVAAATWIIENASVHLVDAKRIAIGGDSAGANLATVASLIIKQMRDAGAKLEMPLFQLLIYPVIDLRMKSPSMKTYATGYLLSYETMAYFRRLYTPKQQMHQDWRASPLLAPELSGLPATLIVSAGYDPLRDEGRMYADALSAAGVPTQYLCFERQMHGFIVMGGILDEANTAVRLCAQMLKHKLESVAI